MDLSYSLDLQQALFAPSRTVDNCIDAIADYLTLFGAIEIVRGGVSRVPMPNDPFIQLTEIAVIPLCKPVEIYRDSMGILTEHTRLDIQVDFFGWLINDMARLVHGAFRTIWTSQQFPAWLAPLFCDEPKKLSFSNSEDQVENRWAMVMSVQFNPDLYVPEQSFTSVQPVKFYNQ